MFERFTDHARRVVVLAQEESRLLRHDEIGTEHLLLGLLHDETGDLGQALAAAGVTLSGSRAELEKIHGRGRRDPHGFIPFTSNAKTTLERALQESLRLGHNYIGTPHLLLAILTISDCTAVAILRALRVDAEQLRDAATEVAQDGDPAATASPVPGVVASAGRHGGDLGRKVPRRLHYNMSENSHTLARALLRYGRHEDGCERDPRCTCGLQPLLDLALDNLPPTPET